MRDDRHKNLTVLTPAYNRAGLLVRLFESILAGCQSVEPVEWLVIDDGSTDHTPEVMGPIADSYPGLVRYHVVKNGGKHRAINLASTLASASWILIVDSDDYVRTDALARVIDAISRVEQNENIGVIRGLREFPAMRRQPQFNLTRCGDTCASWVSSGHQFDTAEVVRKSVLSAHQFPEYPGEKFMAESWLWFDIDKTHKTCFVNDQWTVSSYRADGLTARSRLLRLGSPKGAMAVYENVAQAQVSHRLRARAIANWWRYRFHAREMYGSVETAPMPLALAPIGLALFTLDIISRSWFR